MMMIVSDQEVVGDMKGELLELMQVAKKWQKILACLVTHEAKSDTIVLAFCQVYQY